jgi:hypothetical protein
MKTLKRLLKDDLALRKFGKWSLCFDEKGRLFAQNDWVIHQIIIYSYRDGSLIGGGTWSTDVPEMLPHSVADYLDENYKNIARLQSQYFDYLGA